jgi:hypothetical protein
VIRNNQNQNHLQFFLSVNDGSRFSKTFRVAKRPVVNSCFLLSLSSRGPVLRVTG